MNEDDENFEYIRKILKRYGYVETDEVFMKYEHWNTLLKTFIFQYTGNNRKLIHSIIKVWIYPPNKHKLELDDYVADLMIANKNGNNNFYTRMPMTELFGRLERITGINWIDMR